MERGNFIGDAENGKDTESFVFSPELEPVSRCVLQGTNAT